MKKPRAVRHATGQLALADYKQAINIQAKGERDLAKRRGVRYSIAHANRLHTRKRAKRKVVSVPRIRNAILQNGDVLKESAEPSEIDATVTYIDKTFGRNST